MRDLDQAQNLDIDTSDVVVVTHPDKKARYGGGPAQFQMTRLAFVKRDLASRGYRIEGDAGTAKPPTSREQALMAEVDQLRQQLAQNTQTTEPSKTDDERDQLRQRLDALGVSYHHNAGVAKLQAQLDEALAALQDDDFGDEDE